MLELFEILGPILQTGAVGAMLVVMVRWLKAKDRQLGEVNQQQNEERKEMFESHSELIQEVTAALVNKNNTDDKMATAIVKLADELREIHEVLKRHNDEIS